MKLCSPCSRRFPPPLSSLYSRRCRCTLFAFGLVLRHHGLPWAGSCTPLVPVLRHHGLPSGWCLSPRVALGWCLHPPCAGACHHGLPSGWLPWADACHPPCAGILPRVAFGPGCLRAVLTSFSKSLCTSSDAAALNGQTLSILYYRHRRASFRYLPSYLITY